MVWMNGQMEEWKIGWINELNLSQLSQEMALSAR